jgi:hypothetical protein
VKSISLILLFAVALTSTAHALEADYSSCPQLTFLQKIRNEVTKTREACVNNAYEEFKKKKQAAAEQLDKLRAVAKAEMLSAAFSAKNNMILCDNPQGNRAKNLVEKCENAVKEFNNCNQGLDQLEGWTWSREDAKTAASPPKTPPCPTGEQLEQMRKSRYFHMADVLKKNAPTYYNMYEECGIFLNNDI